MYLETAKEEIDGEQMDVVNLRTLRGLVAKKGRASSRRNGSGVEGSAQSARDTKNRGAGGVVRVHAVAGGQAAGELGQGATQLAEDSAQAH